MPANGLFNILAHVDSTNNYAMAMVHAGMAEYGMAWFTLSQTAGRGRRGRAWQGEAGQNIALSVVLQPSALVLANPFSLSMAAALACYRFFSPLAGEGTCIKWPNDLYWRDRKAGGILIENTYQGSNWQWAVVGIGININQTAFEAMNQKAVSLRQITGKTFDATELGRHLHGLLLQTVDEFAQAAPGVISTAYNALLYKRGQLVKLRKGNQVFDTTITGVSPEGLLLTKDSLERSFSFDEVAFVQDR